MLTLIFSSSLSIKITVVDQNIISASILTQLNIVRKTYRWLALICIVVFWSIFIKDDTIKVLGIEIEQNQISLLLYFLVTGSSLYVIERFRRISTLVRQLSPDTKKQTLDTVMIHEWLLNPFAYDQYLSIEQGLKTKEQHEYFTKLLSKLNLHSNAIKLTFIPVVQIFMTLVLANQQGTNSDINLIGWLTKTSYIITSTGIIYLLYQSTKAVDNAFARNLNRELKYLILKNRKIRGRYLRKLADFSVLIFAIVLYFGYGAILLVYEVFMAFWNAYTQ